MSKQRNREHGAPAYGELHENILRLSKAYRDNLNRGYLQMDALYHQLRVKFPEMSIGQMHDAIRELHQADCLRLYPCVASGHMIVHLGGDYCLVVGGKIMMYSEVTGKEFQADQGSEDKKEPVALMA